MRIGVLTGGGDCPGLNAAIRAVVVSAARDGDEVIGFRDGWRGVIDDDAFPLDSEVCRDVHILGGTILGTSRTNPTSVDGGHERVIATLSRRGVDALVAIGGEDTLGAAHRLAQLGVPAVGVPKTIDNDLSATEVTFGFDTAVQIATEAIDRLRTTAESHHRVMVCEVMGRHVGWIAAHSGIAGGAAEILVPEIPFDLDRLCDRLRGRHRRGQFSSIVVVAEGALPKVGLDGSTAGSPGSSQLDQFGHVRLGGIGAWLAEQIERQTGYETRFTTLGHIQRGGTPTAWDRVLATRFGVAAVAAIREGQFDSMVALQAGEIVVVPLADAVSAPKTLDLRLIDEVAAPFLG
jgi:ATP-dependent phosphofructokinase / diphosphate-dependent phosphofructokinase